MRWTRIAFLAAAAIAALGYFLRGSAAFAGVLVFLAVYAMLALISVLFAGRHVEAECAGSGTCEKGGASDMTLTVRRDTRVPQLAICRTEVSAVNLFTGEKDVISADISAKAVEKLRSGDSCCGRIEAGVTNAYVTDPLKIFRKKVRSSGKASAIVTPSLSEISIPAGFLESYDMRSYVYSQYRKGSDTAETFGIREYENGDSVRNVHWKLSAKMGGLMVKIPSYPVENNIIVILNNCLERGEELPAEKKSALAELFFSLSYTLLNKGISHSAGWYDSRRGRFEIREINSTADMWNCISEVLGAGFAYDGVSAAVRYLEALEGQVFTNHFYVTASGEADIDKLEQNGAVRVFRSR
ncbi:MAG: DUF58 domain-containing protein [Anaerovoracaceae bacterium]